MPPESCPAIEWIIETSRSSAADNGGRIDGRRAAKNKRSEIAPDGSSNLRREKLKFSVRGYHHILKVARTLADLDGSDMVGRLHLAEAISYRIAGERLSAAA